MFSLIEYNKKEKGEKFGIRKKVPLRLYRIPFRGGEENKIKRREKVFPLSSYFLLMGKANERSRGNRDWNNYSIMKTRGNLKNDLCKSSPRFGESPRHQLNQEGLLFNYLGRRVGLVSPPCASVPDILSAAINEKERKKKNPASVKRAGNRASIELSIEGSKAGIENQSIKITCFRLEANPSLKTG